MYSLCGYKTYFSTFFFFFLQQCTMTLLGSALRGLAYSFQNHLLPSLKQRTTIIQHVCKPQNGCHFISNFESQLLRACPGKSKHAHAHTRTYFIDRKKIGKSLDTSRYIFQM